MTPFATGDAGSSADFSLDCGEPSRASTWLGENGPARGIPAEPLSRLDLCMTEAVANVIDHGGAGTPARPIHLRLEVRGGEAAVTVSDDGAPFDPRTAPLKPPPRVLADAEPGGLGLAMLREFADALDYSYREGRNHLTIRVRWQAPAAALDGVPR